jgi:uncharacterized protein YbjT (DUF2867 family)
MARRPDSLRARVGEEVDVVRGDVTDYGSLRSALSGVTVAYYLVHSLAAGADFEQTERLGAENFARAARECGVQRIVYLGGLADAGAARSSHMRSRLAVGDILRGSGVPTIEFRASIIIGAGSLSFDLIRSLVTKLPVMTVPTWVRVKAQPIAISDVLAYLVEALDVRLGESATYEIGGSAQLSYLDLMRRYGEIKGLRRIYINLPFLTPGLSSLWLNLVTPVFARAGRKLIDSICVASVVTDDRAQRDFQIRPMDVTTAIRAAQTEEDETFAQTRWSDALSSAPAAAAWGGRRLGSRIVDSRVVQVDATPEAAFAVVERIGGVNGWYYGNILWKLRGLLDRMIGGVGMQRGRRDAERLRVDDVLDCWRVEAVEQSARLLLRAEMKVPGRAWLQFEVNPAEGGVEIRQTAVYDPWGLSGLLYWYTLYPLHELVFAGMLRNIGRRAESAQPPRRIRRPRRSAPPVNDRLPPT